jgi:hypothetical protein
MNYPFVVCSTETCGWIREGAIGECCNRDWRISKVEVFDDGRRGRGLRIKEGAEVRRGEVIAELNGQCFSDGDEKARRQVEEEEGRTKLLRRYQFRREVGWWMALHQLAPREGWFANATCDKECATAELAELVRRMGGKLELLVVLLARVDMSGGDVVWVFYRLGEMMCLCGLGNCISKRLVEGEGLTPDEGGQRQDSLQHK